MKINKWFGDAYVGNIPLWQAVVFGLCIPLVPITILSGIGKELMVRNESTNIVYAIVVFVFLYYLWITIVLWKNSKNTNKNFYKFLGRSLSVLTGLVTISILSAFFKT